MGTTINFSVGDLGHTLAAGSALCKHTQTHTKSFMTPWRTPHSFLTLLTSGLTISDRSFAPGLNRTHQERNNLC